MPWSFLHFPGDDPSLNQQSSDTLNANAPRPDIASQTPVFTPLKGLTVICREHNCTATANRGLRIIMRSGFNYSPSNGSVTNIE